MNEFNQIIETSINLANFAKKLSDQILSTDADNPFDDYNYKLPSHTMAFLYSKEFENNELYKEDWCADLSIKFVDRWLHPYYEAKKKGEIDYTNEWPVGIIPHIIGLLGDRLPTEKSNEWLGYLDEYCSWSSTKPLGLSAPNHEIWRCFGLYKNGILLNNDNYINAGLLFAEQMMSYQTKHGFWEEGPHHGPSMRYNIVMVTGLAFLYRTSGNELFLEPLKKLVKFMVDFSYPDSTTVGAFDGRQSTSFGFHAPIVTGFELIPEGRAMNANSMKLWNKMNKFNDVENFSNSYWYTFFSSGFFSMTLQYYTELLSEEDRAKSFDDETPLKIETKEKIIINDIDFKGAMYRKNDFITSISGQDSQIPKLIRSIYRLDRQSRIEVWHKKQNLIIGGGHNRRDWNLPYANVIMDTGVYGDTDFGLVNQNEIDKRRHYYISKSNIVDESSDTPNLRVNFGHGYVDFKINVEDNDSFEIDCHFKTILLNKLCIQIPFVIYKEAETKIDGAVIKDHKTHIPITNKFSSSGDIFDTNYEVLIPNDINAKIHYKLPLIEHYVEAHDVIEKEGPISIALLAIQWEGNDANEGSCKIKVNLLS
ncbi:MAG: hypothetical protein COA79_20615 [Planctomycetota bacterium]|nr:MAG: hypothetical protein COA79_20615 [Planctomycetota bacterium]